MYHHRGRNVTDTHSIRLSAQNRMNRIDAGRAVNMLDLPVHVPVPWYLRYQAACWDAAPGVQLRLSFLARIDLAYG